MDALDYVHELFSRDYAIRTVLHLVMAHFGLTEEQAQEKIDEYFAIVDAMDKDRSERGQ